MDEFASATVTVMIRAMCRANQSKIPRHLIDRDQIMSEDSKVPEQFSYDDLIKILNMRPALRNDAGEMDYLLQLRHELRACDRRAKRSYMSDKKMR